jgi:NDP-sugar pyrophosphorylase family protein
MKVSDLFSADAESPLSNWIEQFVSPEELFAHLPQLYAKLNAQRIEGIVEEGAVIVGPVHIGTGAVVHSQAIIRGPVIIGGDTVVSGHAEILSGCFIGSNCVIGHCCSIMHSILMDNATVWPSAFIGNSVIGFGSVVGPGAVLGAERIPLFAKPSHTSSALGVILGNYCTVGANSIIKPGTIIGPRTTIGEAVLAEGIYEPGQIVILAPRT